MLSGLVSCGRYIVGVTYSRPLLRPRVCSRTIGAPSKTPPTLPSFARNSVMVCAFQSLMLNSRRLRSLHGDAFCAGEIRRQALPGPVERRASFVEHRVIRLEDVGHPRSDVERDFDVGDGSLLSEADGV